MGIATGILKGAAALLPGVLGIFGKRQKSAGVDYRGIIDRYRAEKPTGYLTGEDTQFADTNFQSGMEKVGAKMRGNRAAAAGRLLSKGLNRGGISEAVAEGQNMDESGMLTDLERNRTATLYGIKTGREKYQQNMNLQSMLAELSGAKFNFDQAAAQKGGFLNSLLELTPEVFDYFGGLGKSSTPLMPGQGPQPADSGNPTNPKLPN